MQLATESAENLYVPKVRDLMTEEVFSLNPEDNLEFLEDSMKWRRIRHVPVVNESDEVVGLITHRDFLRLAISDIAEIPQEDKKRLYKKILAKEVMTKNIACVEPDTDLITASKILNENKYGCLLVTHKSKLVGILTEADFVQSFIKWDVKFLS